MVGEGVVVVEEEEVAAGPEVGEGEEGAEAEGWVESGLPSWQPEQLSWPLAWPAWPRVWPPAWRAWPLPAPAAWPAAEHNPLAISCYARGS